jgi:anti-anti-sigma factor
VSKNRIGIGVPGLLRGMDNSDTTLKDGLLTVKAEQAGDTLMLWASGELSRSTAERFEAELRKAIENDASTVVLDLGAVGFIDSTGLRSVLRVANHSLRNGGRLRMRNASATVQEAIAWGGLERKLPLVD